MYIIEIENLTHRFYDGTVGLKDISLKIRKGEFVIIAGRNGSGKTILVRHLNGLLKPSTGTVKVSGLEVHKNLLHARRMVGLVFQDADSQIIGETVAIDVAFGPENLSLDKDEIERRVANALNTVGLTNMRDRFSHVLSAGEKRRLSLAGVLAMKPHILVFDEPFSNLDYPGIRQILEQIVNLKKAGHTLIMITHDLEKVLAHADRLIVMDQGRIVQDGPPDIIIKNLDNLGIKKPCVENCDLKTMSWLR